MRIQMIPAAIAALALAAACSSARVDFDDRATIPATGAPSANAGAGDDGGDDDGGDDDDGGGGAGGQSPEGDCEPGEEEACLVVVGEQNGVKTCFRGHRRCDAGGRWGSCRKDPVDG